MRIAFVAGNVLDHGPSQGIVLPLARALIQSGHTVRCFDIAWLGGGGSTPNVDVRKVGLLAQSLRDPLHVMREITRRLQARKGSGRTWPAHIYDVSGYDRLASRALHISLSRFDPDLTYAIMNVNVFRVVASPLPLRGLLAINLVGFGIDRSRGGAMDTFPLQSLLFQRPIWSLHITSTRFEFERYRSVYQRLGLDPRVLLELPYCVEPEWFTGHERAVTQAPDRRERVLIYPVQVYPRKNIEFAIRVLARVRAFLPARLIVTGRVWDRPYLRFLTQEALAAGVADSVSFPEGVPREQLRALVRQADAVVFPSHQETFGLGLAESLAAGTPVVAPGWLPACASLLEGMPGVQLAPKNVDDFADAVLRVLREPPDRAFISASARGRFSTDVVVDRLLHRVAEIADARHVYQATLSSIDWRGLYGDAGDLGLDRCQYSEPEATLGQKGRGGRER